VLSRPGVRVIAHRGFAAERPENTLAALRAAARSADAVEFDVRRCGSGELVVVHDVTVDRVTDASGPVSSFSLSELRALDVLGSGEGVPTLRDALDAVPPDVAVNADLKEVGTARDAAALLSATRHDALVSSFHPEALARVRDRVPALDAALLFQSDPGGSLRRALGLGCAAVHPRADRCLDTDLVAAAHDADLAVNAWTVRDRETAVKLRQVGVDGLIADRTDLLAGPR
jgi:glycerophosphoryl diester phosphodiesterase